MIAAFRNYTIKRVANLYIFDGQSNNKGKGEVSELTGALAEPIESAKIWFNDSFATLEAGVNQYGYCLTESGTYDPTEFGPEMQFANEINQRVYIVKVGRGATTLAAVSGTDHNISSTGELHANMIQRVTDAVAYLESQNMRVVYKAYFWNQGEGDAQNATYANAYLTNINNKISAVKALFPGIKFIISRLPSGQPYTYLTTVRNAQTNSNADVVIDTDAFDLQNDDIHYSTSGQIQLGSAYVNAIL